MKNYDTIDKHLYKLEKYGAEALCLEYCGLLNKWGKMTEEKCREFFILLNHGKDFSRTSHVLYEKDFIMEESSRIPIGDCHKQSFFQLHNLLMMNPRCFPRLYWGYCDQFVGGKWVGMINHSWVVVKDYWGHDIVLDLYADVKYPYDKREIFYTTYFGIHIPAHMLYTVWHMEENPSHGANFSAYLKNNVFINDEETEKFEKFLEHEAELSASFLFFIPRYATILLYGAT